MKLIVAPQGEFEIGYEFYSDPHGNPPGQIKAYEVRPFEGMRRRIAANNLPLQERKRFVSLTGCAAEDIGVDMNN